MATRKKASTKAMKKARGGLEKTVAGTIEISIDPGLSVSIFQTATSQGHRTSPSVDFAIPPIKK